MPIVNGLGLSGEHDNPDWPRYLRTTDIAGPRSLRSDVFASQPPEIAARALVQKGDILMTAAGATIGKSVLIGDSSPACFAGFLVRFRPNADTDPRFVSYWAQSHDYWAQIELGAVRSTIDNFSASRYRNLEISIPDIDEQHRIADFLDSQISGLDNVIAARQKQVELLEESVRAFIEHSVWLGLEDSPMASTGIDPAPVAPKHWQRRRNRYLLREVADLSDSGDEELLSVSHLTGVSPRSLKTVSMFMAESLEGYKRVLPADLVINTLWAWMGALGVSRVAGIVSPAYGVYRPISADYYPDYFDYLYRTSAYVCEMTRHSKGVWSSRLRLYPESFLGLWVVVPPLKEQQSIVAEIEKVKALDDTRAASLRLSIELLLELRSSLITAAVTGEMDLSATGGKRKSA